MNTATQTGANPDVKEGEVSVNTTMSPRDVALAAMEDRTDEAHAAQIYEDTEGDPGAKLIHDTIVDQQEANREAAVKAGIIPPLDDGAMTREPMHPEQKMPPAALPEKKVPELLPVELQEDPLAEYVVMDEGKPMFALKVNGKNLLMPLDEARRKLQIRTAAGIDMQDARKFQKDLDVRSQNLTAGEAALKARVQAQPVQTSVPAPIADLSEKEIRSRANDVFTTAFSGSEEEAGEKLTKLLLDVRTPTQLAAAPIDRAEIVQEASAAAVDAVIIQAAKKDLRVGYTKFQDEYPEIMADENLYNMTDGMTDGIATEHPEWDKSQVMLEAGKRTSEWVENLKGTTEPGPKDPETIVTTENETISEQPRIPQTQLRQDRKSELVVIPQPAQAVQAPDEPEPPPQTPQEALDEIRKSRGQAV